MNIRLKAILSLSLLFAGIGLVFTLSTAKADVPGNHPHYLHALSDLRAARWLLHHPEEWNVERDAREAHERIDKAIYELKRASIDDGKNLEDHPPAEANLDQRGRFHHAREYLESARRNLAFEEDNQAALGWRRAAREHIDHAIRKVNDAIRAKHWDNEHGN